jgi:hypothetical protein
MIKVGDRFESNKGQWMVVLEVVNQDKILIEFEDEHKHRKWIDSSQVKDRGNVKNPFFPLLFGVGYYGVGKYKSTNGPKRLGHKNLPAYSAWINMLSRCYDKNYIDPHLYKNSTVHEEWYNFQVFAEWYHSELNNVGWEGRINTDKDILGDGSIYSSKTCCLVPVKINSAVRQAAGGKYLPGVRKAGENFRVFPGYDTSNVRFKTELDAHMAFVESKSKKIVEVANEYKEQIKPVVYETLCTKDFRYKFSPYFENTKLP